MPGGWTPLAPGANVSRRHLVGKINSHRDLVVWQKAMDLAEVAHRLARHLPRPEATAIVFQMTRAAVSVPANIAEGHARGGRKSYANFLTIARGSLMELQTYLLLAARLGYLDVKQSGPALDLVAEISKMLTVLRARVQASGDPAAKQRPLEPVP